MSARSWVKDYLSFNRSDRVAILILLTLIVILFFIPRLVSRHLSSPAGIAPDTAWLANFSKTDSTKEDSGDPNMTDHWQYDRLPRETRSVAALFYFDPNTLDAAGWERLGLRGKTIQTIVNYRSKGGHFRTAEDLSRIYGLRGGELERLRPYVRIAAGPSNEKTGEIKPAIATPARQATRFAAVDINLADTAAFIDLPGIGSKLAARIVNFRDKLGGFYAIAQVGETFGLADSIFQKIKPYLKMESSSVKKISINTAMLEQLKAHPYIRYALAKTIITYRDEHGPFESIDELKKINAITADLFDKMAPYLEL